MITSAAFNPLTIDIAGVLLPKIPHYIEKSRPSASAAAQSQQKPLILSKTTAHNLHRLALAVSLSQPILLEGPTGSGKTSLIDYIAHRLDLLGTFILV